MPFFDLERIHTNYRLVQADFARINGTINCARDAFDDGVVQHLMLAYDYLNKRMSADTDAQPLNASDMLELNAIVHLGLSPAARLEYTGFLDHTYHKFDKYFPDLQKWYLRHESNNDDPYKIAAGIYVRILAEPQLFFDGNHRTGALIANNYLLRKGMPPFVVTPENAVEFFNLASDIKFKKRDIRSKFKRAVGWHDEVHAMRGFLMENAQDFTIQTLPEWTGAQTETAARYTVTNSVKQLSSTI